MSSLHSKKKKSKSPVKIKSENHNEQFTMEHYIGEPVELIKQIFSSLNSKTIKSLAPDFMKKSTIAEIEELCLNELLGISSKRLKSIITATNCPTDTESSSDSDVENVEEHISLEEISSDSANDKKSKGKKRKSKNIVNIKRKGENGKEMSVLELLELQARARAIRSQLALEPIAKIEVNSDDSDQSQTVKETPKPAQTIVAKIPAPPVRARKRTISGISTNNAVTAPTPAAEKNKPSGAVNGEATASTSTQIRPRKIKLKRNFRKRSPEKLEVTISNENTEKVTTVASTSHAIKSEQIEKNTTTTNSSERSPSPDVLTIIPDYEVLCISDSDDDDKIENSKKAVEPINNQAENAKINEFEADKNQKESAVLIPPPENIDKIEDIDENQELEDGEIVDVQTTSIIEEDNHNDDDDNVEHINVNDKSNDDQTVEDLNKSDTEEPIKMEKPTEPETLTTEVNLNDDDQSNDDVISLGDEDLDYEMHGDIDVKPTIVNIPKIELVDDEEEKHEDTNEIDFIDLHDSSDEETSDKFTDPKGQSWNTRWLESSKVSKILATSKLANRVRDKLKKDRKAEQELQQQIIVAAAAAAIEEIEQQNSPKVIFSSSFEDGSIQQYKEILNREKTTDS